MEAKDPEGLVLEKIFFKSMGVIDPQGVASLDSRGYYSVSRV